MATDTALITPRWAGLVSVMLDVRENIRRQLLAKTCDGFEDGWCSIHNTGYDLSTDRRTCDFWTLPRLERDAWRASLVNDLDAVNGEFLRMARLADLHAETADRAGE